jgi:predicted O-methyltransferase YrrM
MDRAVELPPCEVLREILRTGETVLPDGTRKRLTSHIRPEAARALHDTVLREAPGLVVEIGMAQGVSTLSILTALAKTGGRLISVDPYEGWPSGRLAARHAVERAGFADRHTHLEAKSYEALPRLLAEGTVVDLGYIDGWHTFDYALLDFFYLDRMLRAGGVVGFNDAGWRSVFHVLRYVRTHRRYDEIDVGLPRDFAARNLLFSLARRLQGRQGQDRYFRKREAWEPPVHFFVRP